MKNEHTCILYKLVVNNFKLYSDTCKYVNTKRIYFHTIIYTKNKIINLKYIISTFLVILCI